MEVFVEVFKKIRITGAGFPKLSNPTSKWAVNGKSYQNSFFPYYKHATHFISQLKEELQCVFPYTVEKKATER